jgi:hypothetical protein
MPTLSRWIVSLCAPGRARARRASCFGSCPWSGDRFPGPAPKPAELVTRGSLGRLCGKHSTITATIFEFAANRG